MTYPREDSQSTAGARPAARNGEDDLLVALRQISELRGRILRQAIELDGLGSVISDIRNENAVLQSANTDLGNENAELRSENTRLVEERDTLRSANATLREEGVLLAQERTSLQASVNEWQAFQRSRSYRIARAYIALNRGPIAGPLLRLCRRVLRWPLAAIRRGALK